MDAIGCRGTRPFVERLVLADSFKNGVERWFDRCRTRFEALQLLGPQIQFNALNRARSAHDGGYRYRNLVDAVASTVLDGRYGHNAMLIESDGIDDVPNRDSHSKSCSTFLGKALRAGTFGPREDLVGEHAIPPWIFF